MHIPLPIAFDDRLPLVRIRHVQEFPAQPGLLCQFLDLPLHLADSLLDKRISRGVGPEGAVEDDFWKGVSI